MSDHNPKAFPSWGLVVRATPDELVRFMAANLREYRADDINVIQGNEGYSVLLYFPPGSADTAIYLGEALVRQGRDVTVLDFHRHGPGILTWSGDSFAPDPETHPADFAEQFGVVVPGYEPGPPSPVRHASYVEGATRDQVKPHIIEGAT